ncbi:MAG: LamG domain-containing protein [Sedimentisphaerales bacterium]|nr:LamG domain-containing protein [Sedimentisphaerales bacterium]
MRSTRTRLAVAAVVMLVGAVAILLWQGTGSGVALADVLARLERIDAYTCEATITHTSPEDRRMKSTSWISRNYGTKAVFRDADTGEVAVEAYIVPKERTAVVIQHDEKAYMRFNFDDRLADKLREEIPNAREMLVRLQSCDYASLGASTLDGTGVEGFRTTDPNYPKGGARRVDVSLWVDVATGLPVRSEENIEWNDGTVVHSVSHDFQWDVPIDPAMFQPLIPDGYANAAGGSIRVPAMSEETAVQGLRLCVELNGQYPRVLTEPVLKAYIMYLPEIKSMKKEEAMAYIQDPDNAGPLMQKMMPITALWLLHSMLTSEQREPAYFGDTVTPQSPHAVLLRWKLDDGRYKVILGDLTTRDVLADELAKLEAAPLNLQPVATGPQPADRSVGCALTSLELRWTPGLAAVQHKVYFGQDSHSLTLAATVTEPQCSQLPALARETSYSWRVDEVQADDAVTPGQVWQFNTGRLVAWWRFDGKAGKQVTDASGHGHTGQIRGDPTWTSGISGGALQFDGKGDYVEIGANPEFNMTGQITVAAWFKIASFDKESQALVTKGDRAWRLQKNRGTNSLLFACFGLKTADEWGATRGRTKVDDDRWHHAVGVYDGTRIALYIDGKLDASAPASGRIATNDEPVLIGENSERPNRFWHGLIDEVRIYSYALSEDEITALYEEASPNVAPKTP